MALLEFVGPQNHGKCRTLDLIPPYLRICMYLLFLEFFSFLGPPSEHLLYCVTTPGTNKRVVFVSR